MRNARILSVSLACIVALSYAQNVGIGTATPTERLHVAGNLRLDNAFMPGNLPGAVGNLLLSQGAGLAPIWLSNGPAGSILMSMGPGNNPIWAPNPICTSPTLNRLIKFTNTSPVQTCNTTLAENNNNQIWNAGDGPGTPFPGDKFSIFGTAANPWPISGYATAANTAGVFGQGTGAGGIGVQGATNSGTGAGVLGINTNPNGPAGYFENTAAAGTGGGDGVIGFTHQQSGNGVWARTDHPNSIGALWATSDAAVSATSTAAGAAIISRQRGGSTLIANLRNDANLSTLYFGNTVISAIHFGGTGPSGAPPAGVIASINSGDNNARAIIGQHTNTTTTVNAYAVVGFMERGGNSTPGTWAVGVLGHNLRTGANDWAVFSNGWFGATNKAFLIDHPLDPENKYLLHACAEGPEPYNIYRGVVVTDANGYAEVELPAYFSAANKEPSYYLTPIGTFAQAIIEREVQNNRFAIRTDKPNVKVSWVVLATRDDAYARYARKPTEFEKEPEHRGKYLNPYVYGKDESYGIFPGPVQMHTSEGKKADTSRSFSGKELRSLPEKSLNLQEGEPRK